MSVSGVQPPNHTPTDPNEAQEATGGQQSAFLPDPREADEVRR